MKRDSVPYQVEREKEHVFSSSLGNIHYFVSCGSKTLQRLIFPGGSPAKHVTGEELLKMSAALDNLSIIHEIAIDPNFKIPEKPANPIEAAVR